MRLLLHNKAARTVSIFQALYAEQIYMLIITYILLFAINYFIVSGRSKTTCLRAILPKEVKMLFTEMYTYFVFC